MADESASLVQPVLENEVLTDDDASVFHSFELEVLGKCDLLQNSLLKV